NCVAATLTYIFSTLVDLVGSFGDAPDAVFGKAYIDAFRLQQGLLLLREGCARLGEYALEIIGGECTEFHANGQAALKFGDQVGWLAQVESAGRDKQYVIRFDHAVLGAHGATFDQWQ